jgi:hypothetical protein
MTVGFGCHRGFGPLLRRVSRSFGRNWRIALLLRRVREEVHDIYSLIRRRRGWRRGRRRRRTAREVVQDVDPRRRVNREGGLGCPNGNGT